MLISVVVTFYNQGEYVFRALKSVIGQTYPELEIIVVDDGSDRSIEDFVNRLADERIRFFRKNNGGAASARNFGVGMAGGEYIAFLDGDDVWLPTKIERTVALLNASGNPECIVSTGAYVFNNKISFSGQVEPAAYNAGDIINTSLVRPSCTVYHKNVFGELGGFPEELQSNEDGAFNSVATQFFPVRCDQSAQTLYYRDEAGLARKFLRDYELGVQVMEQRLAFIGAKVAPEVETAYRQRSYRDLCYGFLSAGNLSAAKKWCKKQSLKLDYSLSGLLAHLSLSLGINLYAMVRYLRLAVSTVMLFPAWLKLRGLLKK